MIGHEARYLLGVDGGNTKTIALVASPDGAIVGAARGGCGDIYGYFDGRPPHEAEAVALCTLETTVHAALQTAGLRPCDLRAGGFSLAGADWPEDVEFLRNTLAARGFGARITVVNDAIGPLRAGSADGTGVSVVCGTGGAIGARGPDGSQWNASFWLEGFGAHSLAQSMLRAVYRAELGIDAPTRLTARALHICEQPSVEAVLHAFTARASTARAPVERLVRALLDEAHEGEATAVRIVDAEASLIGSYALTAAKRVGLADRPFTLVVAGGVFGHASSVLYEAICGHVSRAAPEVRPIRLHCQPAVGALYLAFDAAGLALDEAGAKRVQASLPRTWE